VFDYKVGRKIFGIKKRVGGEVEKGKIFALGQTLLEWSVYGG
jgi:hypothetical protein